MAIDCQCLSTSSSTYQITIKTSDSYESECVGIYAEPSPNTVDCFTEGAAERRLFCPFSAGYNEHTYNISTPGTYYCIGWSVLCVNSFKSLPVTCVSGPVPEEPTDPETPIPKSGKSKNQSSVTVITLSVLGGLIIFIAFVGVILFYRRKMMMRRNSESGEDYAPVSLTDLTEDHSVSYAPAEAQSTGMVVLTPVYVATNH